MWIWVGILGGEKAGMPLSSHGDDFVPPGCHSFIHGIPGSPPGFSPEIPILLKSLPEGLAEVKRPWGILQAQGGVGQIQCLMSGSASQTFHLEKSLVPVQI